MRRALVATTLAILLWSAQDAIIWRGWFDGRPWSRTVDVYQFWHQALLVALIVVGMALLRGKWAVWFAGATWVLANSGLPDVLYYWLALRPLPENWPWLDAVHPLVIGHPATTGSVLLSSAIWLAVALASAAMFRLAELNHLVKEAVDRDVERVVVGGGL